MLVDTYTYQQFLSVFSAPVKYRVVKIVRSSFEVVLWIRKHPMIYPDSSPSSEVIALRPASWYWRWTSVIRGEQSAWEVYMVKGEWISYPLPER
jgi:hypothetical protein